MVDDTKQGNSNLTDPADRDLDHCSPEEHWVDVAERFPMSGEKRMHCEGYSIAVPDCFEVVHDDDGNELAILREDYDELLEAGWDPSESVDVFGENSIQFLDMFPELEGEILEAAPVFVATFFLGSLLNASPGLCAVDVVDLDESAVFVYLNSVSGDPWQANTGYEVHIQPIHGRRNIKTKLCMYMPWETDFSARDAYDMAVAMVKTIQFDGETAFRKLHEACAGNVGANEFTTTVVTFIKSLVAAGNKYLDIRADLAKRVWGATAEAPEKLFEAVREALVTDATWRFKGEVKIADMLAVQDRDGRFGRKEKTAQRNIERLGGRVSEVNGTPYEVLSVEEVDALLGDRDPMAEAGGPARVWESAEGAPLDEFRATIVVSEPENEAGARPLGAAILELLCQDRIFFNPGEITWDGTHHGFTGMQFGSRYLQETVAFAQKMGYGNASEFGGAILETLGKVEQDEALRVPRERISPALREAIGEGDLTGITLANLAAVYCALLVKQPSEGEFQVFMDGNLERGIPRLYDLVLRLLWDLNATVVGDGENTFKVTFARARNLDFEEYLELDGPVERVAGADIRQTPFVVEVTEEPAIDLSDLSDAAPGGEEAVGSPSVDWTDEDDETAYEARKVVDLFKENDGHVTLDISGTHYFNRNDHIKDIRVGDKVLVAADWECPFFDDGDLPAFEAFDQAGRTLGYLGVANHAGSWSCLDDCYEAFAAALPFMVAEVESVTHVSKRNRKSKYSLMDVRFTLLEGVTADDIVAAVRELNGRSVKDRYASTGGVPKTIGELKGGITGWDPNTDKKSRPFTGEVFVPSAAERYVSGQVVIEEESVPSAPRSPAPEGDVSSRDSATSVPEPSVVPEPEPDPAPTPEELSLATAAYHEKVLAEYKADIHRKTGWSAQSASLGVSGVSFIGDMMACNRHMEMASAEALLRTGGGLTKDELIAEADKDPYKGQMAAEARGLRYFVWQEFGRNPLFVSTYDGGTSRYFLWCQVGADGRPLKDVDAQLSAMVEEVGLPERPDAGAIEEAQARLEEIERRKADLEGQLAACSGLRNIVRRAQLKARVGDVEAEFVAAHRKVRLLREAEEAYLKAKGQRDAIELKATRERVQLPLDEQRRYIAAAKSL